LPKFRYTAVDPAGKLVRGSLEAANASLVADQLRGQGRLLLNADEIGKQGGLYDLLHSDFKFERGMSKPMLAHVTRELAVMLEAGQDIDHALRFLVESAENKRVRRVLERLRNQVRGGKSLAAALAEHPRIFSRLYVSLVRAGEAGGELAESLTNLADMLERQAKLTATIQSAMTYPVLLVIASVGTIVMLLTYVLPQFTPIFEQAGAKLPRPTQILITAAETAPDSGTPDAACAGRRGVDPPVASRAIYAHVGDSAAQRRQPGDSLGNRPRRARQPDSDQCGRSGSH